MKYDVFGNITEIAINGSAVVNYEYTNSFDSQLVKEIYANSSIKYPSNIENKSGLLDKYIISKEIDIIQKAYTFDENYNVISSNKDDFDVEYSYDNHNWLTFVNYKSNNINYKYEYDERGNIIRKQEIDLNNAHKKIIDYKYDSLWQDQLIQIDDQEIIYDEIGNPLKYKGFDMTWKNGCQLSHLESKDNLVRYTYDNNGIRKEKIVNGKPIKFKYIGNLIVEQESDDSKLVFFSFLRYN